MNSSKPSPRPWKAHHHEGCDDGTRAPCEIHDAEGQVVIRLDCGLYISKVNAEAMLKAVNAAPEWGP